MMQKERRKSRRKTFETHSSLCSDIVKVGVESSLIRDRKAFRAPGAYVLAMNMTVDPEQIPVDSTENHMVRIHLLTTDSCRRNRLSTTI